VSDSKSAPFSNNSSKVLAPTFFIPNILFLIVSGLSDKNIGQEDEFDVDIFSLESNPGTLFVYKIIGGL
jgi:hypothetical protein